MPLCTDAHLAYIGCPSCKHRVGRVRHLAMHTTPWLLRMPRRRSSRHTPGSPNDATTSAPHSSMLRTAGPGNPAGPGIPAGPALPPPPSGPAPLPDAAAVLGWLSVLGWALPRATELSPATGAPAGLAGRLLWHTSPVPAASRLPACSLLRTPAAAQPAPAPEPAEARSARSRRCTLSNTHRLRW